MVAGPPVFENHDGVRVRRGDGTDERVLIIAQGQRGEIFPFAGVPIHEHDGDLSGLDQGGSGSRIAAIVELNLGVGRFRPNRFQRRGGSPERRAAECRLRTAGRIDLRRAAAAVLRVGLQFLRPAERVALP
jgi:hypothetical protein